MVIGKSIWIEWCYTTKKEQFNNYLDWLFALPWGEYRFDCPASVSQFIYLMFNPLLLAYGLRQKVLTWFLIFLIFWYVGKIIRLSGPPVVGKTSIGCSIARALNRKFFRFSVGGLADVAEIKVNKISVSFNRFNWYQLYSNVLWCFVSLILNLYVFICI
jgi:ATP-dependent Lon protease